MANFPGSKPRAARKKSSVIRPLIFLLLIASVIALQYCHLEQYLDQGRLRQFAATHEVLLPLIYLAVWTVGPLFLPGLPIILAGGVIFGPIWGVVYTAFGSAAGAALVFLVARYLARDWVAGKLAGTRLDVPGRESGPAWLENRGLHPTGPRLFVLPAELRLWPHPDFFLALSGRHLRLHAAHHHRVRVLLQQPPGPAPRQDFPGFDHRRGPGGPGEPHPGDLQVEEGQGRETGGSLTARPNQRG